MAVTVTRGVTHSRFTRMLVGGTNLSGNARSLGGVGLRYSQTDMTTWQGNDLHTFYPGLPDVTLGPFQAIFSNTAAANGVQAGSHVVLSSQGTPIVTAAFGIMEAPTIGAPAFSLYSQQLSYTASPVVDDTLIVSADFSAAFGEMVELPGWGQLLAVGTTISSTTSNGSLDNGASSSAGAIGVLHLVRPSGSMASNDWEVKIEHSADDSAWSDLIVFTSDGSATAAEWDDTSATGTVNRYTRVTSTKTAGNNIAPWVNLIRL